MGGAAFCSLCRVKTNELAVATGIDLGRGTCYYNKSVRGPEGCQRPCPELHPGNTGTWRVWQLTFWRDRDFGGGPGCLAGVESAARALRVSWDEQTLLKYFLVEQVWMEARETARRKQEEAHRRASE